MQAIDTYSNAIDAITENEFLDCIQLNIYMDELREYMASVKPVIEKIHDEYKNNYGNTKILEVWKYFNYLPGYNKRILGTPRTYINQHLEYIYVQNDEVLEKLRILEDFIKNSPIVQEKESRTVDAVHKLSDSLYELNRKLWYALHKHVTNDTVVNAARRTLSLYN